MSDPVSRRAMALGLAAGALLPGAALAQSHPDDNTYSQDEIVAAAQRFFGAGAEGVATVIEHVFEDLGRPNGYIQGNEGSGAIGVGLRYGDGRMRLKGGGVTRVFWQGPSIGFDTGGNASKVFTLVYGMRNPDQIFQRFPGVDGSAYFVGGVGVTLLKGGEVIMAPIRSGLGLRLGANIGYVRFSPQPTWNPF